MVIFKSENVYDMNILDTKMSLSDFRIQRLTESYPSHFHSDGSYEIHYFKSGEGVFVIDGVEYEINDRSVFITGPLVSHEQRITAEAIKYSIYLYIPDRKSENEIFQTFLRLKSNVVIYENIKYAFEGMYREFSNEQIGSSYLINAYITGIIIQLVRASNMIENSNDVISNKNLSFEIERILLDEFASITVDEMAGRLFISKRALQRYLQNYYKTTFSKLKCKYRLNTACHLLRTTNKSIHEISNEVGYSSTMHFISAFKELYGTTPLKFRKK